MDLMVRGFSRHAGLARAAAVAVAWLFLAGRAGAQCPSWTAGPLSLAQQGADGEIEAAVEWDPDGAGPAAPVLVVGGTFQNIDGVPTGRVAMWDGLAWHPLGESPNDTVKAIAVYNGQLVIGGVFTACGGVATNRVALWNGNDWQTMGDGVGDPGALAGVTCMTPYAGDLYVGGEFHVPGVPGSNLVLWDGSSWHSVSTGYMLTIHSLGVFGDLLCVGTPCDNVIDGVDYPAAILGWNGSWVQLFGPSQTWPGQSQLYPAVDCMAVHGGALYVGGRGLGEWRWDGSDWTQVGTLGPEANVLVEISGLLYLGGAFDVGVFGGSTARDVAIYSGPGTTWSPVGSGVDMDDHDTGSHVRALTSWSGRLFAGGTFDRAGGLPATDAALWSGASWSAPAAIARVSAACASGSRLALGGNFSQPTSTGEAYHLALWDGLQLASLDDSPNTPVSALLGWTNPGLVSQNVLVVGGGFTSVGPLPASHVAMHVESSAYPFNTWSALGSGFDNAVYALERFNGSIAAGGQFVFSGNTNVNRVALFDGTAWQPMGTGMNGTVRALKVYSTLYGYILLAGGDFTYANGSPANRVAYWTKSAITIDTPWQPMGGGLNGSVYALRVEGGYLYAAGSFSHADGTPAINLARWDGSQWSAVGDGPYQPVYSLLGYNGELWAGGDVTSYGVEGAPSFGAARYLETGAPWVARQPANTTVDAGQTASFQVVPAAGYGSLAFRWRRDGVPLTDGPTGYGSTRSGTASPGLQIATAALADSGAYDCIVSNGCGSATSWAAALDVNSMAGVPGTSLRLALDVGPSPCRGSARIRLVLDRDGAVDASVYDAGGRHVRSLAAGPLGPGEHDFVWDGRDAGGAALGSGVYFVHVETEGRRLDRRVLLVR